jgi:DHA1 family multidrug resistance protein-like MFS transporter
MVASAVGFAIMLFAESYAAVLVTVAFFIFSNTMLRPSLSSLISKRTQGGQGMALGLSSGFESLGRVVGPLWAGALFDINLGLPYASAAVIMLVGFIFSLVWLKNSS